MGTRYLTKSLFKLAMECPTKLFYIGKEAYANNNLEDPFLEALAKGGFQVGALAKAYYPGGHSIDSLDKTKALEETRTLMEQKNCIMYEAAFQYEDYFIRVDILIKQGNDIKLIEVKGKSIDYSHEKKNKTFLTNDGAIKAEWKPYMHDVAFQTYVAEKALQGYEITPYLMLVDKNATCPTDGLNQKFKLSKDSRGSISVTLHEELTKEDLAEKLLLKINVEDVCHQVIYQEKYPYMDKVITFPELIKQFATNYRLDHLIESNISITCKNCEFKASNIDRENGIKSGYHECFKRVYNWEDKDFEEETVFDVWNLHYTKRNRLMEENRIKFSDIKKEDIVENSTAHLPLADANRQWLQIEKSVNKDSAYVIDKKNLRKKMEWTFPLHFIDFETAKPIIPFQKGRKPLDEIAFQFSHHMVHKDGTVEHKSQYLNTEPGVFPNYEFVRHLKSALENDNGTIFRYATHENTYLNKIYNQLQADESFIEDKEELCEFIRDITQYGPKKNRIKGSRNMVDLCELVKNYYYDPSMKDSNSIKVVLPAILNSSDFIKDKYSKPIYGAKDGIKSLNFENQAWVQFDENGEVKDPYSLLPKLFQDLSEKEYEHIDLHEDLNNGGAAMVAYERLQYEDIPQHLRDEIEKGMLKYCELDTLAMVMIYEAWADMVKED